jgi:hypothetical protein
MITGLLICIFLMLISIGFLLFDKTNIKYWIFYIVNITILSAFVVLVLSVL